MVNYTFRRPQLAIEFCSTLLKTPRFVLSEPEDLWFQVLRNQIRYLNNYGRLKQFVERLTPVRRNLLKSLEETANHIEMYNKFGSVFRLIGSITEIAGTVGGFCMRDSKWDYSGSAFAVATGSGFLCTLSTASEVYLSAAAKHDILNQFQKDQALFDPIKNWFNQTETLKIMMLNIFPFETTEEIVNHFVTETSNEFCFLEFFVQIIQKVVTKDSESGEARNELIRKIITLFSSPYIKDLREWVNFQQNVCLDIMKIVLQLHYAPSKLAVCQSVPALLQKDQNLYSVPVLGRMVLNFVTMLNSVNTLRKSEISSLASGMRYLKKELQGQLDALEKMVEYSESRRNPQEF